MDDKQFFEFAYDEYKADLALALSLYQRAGILLTAEVVLGGAAASLCRLDLLPRWSERTDILLMQVASAAVILCLMAGVTFLFAAAWPRDYPKLTKIVFWRQWRKEYWSTLVEDDSKAEERNREALANATLEALVDRLADAQGVAAYTNQRRLQAFRWGTCCLALAVVALCVQSGFALLLKLKGI